jgi:outer membrane lipoprotein-sorting protein
VRSFTSVVLCSCALLSAGATAVEPDAFSELHARAQQVEKSLVTLRADFVETTESDLLTEPIVESGTMIAARPMRVLLRYERPKRKALLIDGNELRLASLEHGEVEALAIREIQDAVDKYFYRSSEKELRSHFDVEVHEDPELPGTHRIDMVATRKRVKKGLAQLQLWVADDTLYPIKMRFIYPEGAGSKTIELSNLRTNVPVDDDEFRIELPPESAEPPRDVGIVSGSATAAPPHAW